MPPKRKRADMATEAPVTRSSTRASAGARRKCGPADVTENAGVSDSRDSLFSNSVEPPPKKTRATSRKMNQTRGTQVIIDEEPLNSTQQQSDDELVMPKQAPVMIEYTQQRAQSLFKKFADSDDPDVIGPGGVEKLCKEAGIPLEGAQPLLLAWQFNAQEMAKLTRSEWLQGTEALRVSSLHILATALKELDDLVVHDREVVMPASSVKKRVIADVPEVYNKIRYRQYALNRNAAFTELYLFSFVLAKPSQSRNIDMETAMALWSVLLTPRYSVITELIGYLSESGTYKGVNKDIWNMVHEFCQTVDGDFSNYETEGAWPTMLDDFVSWKRNKLTRSTNDTTVPSGEVV